MTVHLEEMTEPYSYVFGRTPRSPPGKRCYVIGDVHGRLDLLEMMFDQIARDDAGREPKETSIVLLGDLIDRGPASRGVLERVLWRPPGFASLHIIKGNHEEMLVRGMRGEPEVLPAWLERGGGACLRSFGVSPMTLMGASGEEIARVLGQVISAELVEFMNEFYDYIAFGDYLLVHAGLMPRVPLAKQGRRLRWVREPFLEADFDFGCVVVHGHTIEPDITERPHRIGLDTGAYQTGVLSAVRLEAHERAKLQVTAQPSLR